MANSLTFISLFQKKIDEEMLAPLTSSLMDANAGQVKYDGGSTVKIPVMSLQGYGNYSRTTGFVSGAVTLTYQDFTLTQDRGRSFSVDVMDIDETGGLVEAGAIIGEFQRTKAAPEIDAYRYSKLWDYAYGKGNIESYTPAKATIYSELQDNISALRDVIGDSEPLVIYMRVPVATILNQSTEISHDLPVNDFMRGAVQTKVKSIDGIPIIEVPTARFKTEYTFYDGSTGGQEAGGFVVASLAANMNWIITAQRGPIAVVKHSAMKIFPAAVNQSTDGTLVQMRAYHDIWVPTNKLDGLYISYTAIDAPALTATVAVGTGTGNTKFTATAGSGNTLGYILGAASPGAKYFDLIDGFTGAVEPYTSGADIAATAGQILTMCKVNAEGRIIELKEVTLASGDISS